MGMKKKELIIIGAGLSGLYTAYLLQNDYQITIVEARDRLGGRIFGIDDHDMGPSWVWAHQKHILKVIETFKLTLFAQYTKGLALYDVPQGVERFHPPGSDPSARIQGGMSKLIEAIAQSLSHTTILLNHPVNMIKEQENRLEVTTPSQNFQADYVISTLPPRLAANLRFEPKLPPNVLKQLQNTPTWMGYATKCVIEYQKPFWRDSGLSGFAFSHRGPLGEIHDATTSKHAALFGFLHTKYEADPKAIEAQLVRMYGAQAKNFTAMHIVKWHEQPYTATAEDATRLTDHPPYGYTLFHFDERLHFSGTESSYESGGYLEGAIVAAKTMATKLLP